MGHVLVANMTGNIVFLGFSLGGAKGFSASSFLAALGSFLLGAAVGGRLGAALEATRRRWLIAAWQVERREGSGDHHRGARLGAAEDDELGVAEVEPDLLGLAAVVDHGEYLHSLGLDERCQAGHGFGD